MVLLREPFPPKIQTMPTVLSTDARKNLGPLGGRKGWGGGRVGGAEGLGGRGGGGEEHEYPVFHLFLV